MNLLSCDYYQDTATDQYGLARTITLIKAARAEAPNSLLFDNGDLLQGNPLGDVVAKVAPLKDGQVHPACKATNQLGHDAANLGNHDFNYGRSFLRRELIDAEGKKHPIKVGVIGFVPPQIMQWGKTNVEGRVVVRDMAATARKYVPEMRGTTTPTSRPARWRFGTSLTSTCTRTRRRQCC